ncbi:MAG: hypothetical protein U1D33_04500 [bacterium]|nr:hypothetical protein [bacterium]
MRGRAILICAIVFWAGGAVAQERVPPIEIVSQKALAYARLDPATISGWRKNIRKAPILPRLQFGYERRIRDYVNVDIQDTVAVNSSGITVGPAQQQQVQNLDNNNNFEVKAIWYLDQLLFSQDDVDISAEARELARERERILGQVRQFYFKRERITREMGALKKMGGTGMEWELKRLELAEATAALDNLTGGWFGAAFGGEG